MGPLEDGAGPNGEIDLAGEATIVSFDLSGLDPVIFTAMWADGAAMPADFLDMVAGRPLVWESFQEFVGADCNLIHGRLSLVQSSEQA